MAYRITQLSYQEGIFQFDNSIYESGKPVSVSMLPIMRCSEEKDNIIVLQLTVLYKKGEETIMKYGGIVIYMVDSLKDLTKDEALLKDFKVNIWSEALLFFRGVICEKLRGTAIDNVFLPILRTEDIVSIKIETNKNFD